MWSDDVQGDVAAGELYAKVVEESRGGLVGNGTGSPAKMLQNAASPAEESIILKFTWIGLEDRSERTGARQ
jgi:hypothetical protein